MNKKQHIFLVGLAILTLSLSAHAETRYLKLGESTRIGGTEVYCVAEAKKEHKVDNDQKCHKFHSSNECQGLAMGTPCVDTFHDVRGTCMSTGIFAGAPNCKCQ